MYSVSGTIALIASMSMFWILYVLRVSHSVGYNDAFHLFPLILIALCIYFYWKDHVEKRK
ncbi:hypothetical protein J2W97_003624 [Paenibacillus jamilae]|jgi:hypothetical protein|uniref:Uncharacterized protein n=1 Tax=Paenibacillus polymyxa TaxID=1406 RepID=A0A378Y6N5_PAEPO|nr:hypothetical protein C1A50_5108 [Paenibacillus polymyxa]MDP9677614.1 hypothetical protein [Paenibacillus jamilae]UOD86531.1 hypothetical protein CUU60_15455 [Paenibacillus polymyxa ATCC 842]KJK30242.1 hypothetical protein TY89_14845 [Paenibacillus polymyxa]MBG9762303.1 hypothetical protein [Paenibacillus polymyxa]